MKIGIDPGHGGRDPGAVGPTGIREKDVTLPISLELGQLLKQAGFEPVLTRIDDRAVELATRSSMLNNQNCDLAISVHINSAARREADYISTFIQGKNGEAEKLAQKVQAELVRATGWPDGGVRGKDLHMTRETKMPAILVECGFISNPEQERQLRQPETQKKLAQAIAGGILEYVGRGNGLIDWKQSLMQEAAKEKLIDPAFGHHPDEPATKWFVLAVAMNLLKRVIAT